MSHSTVLVVVPAAAVEKAGGPDNIDDALAEVLEPFDENKDTEQYIRKTKAELIADRRRYYERVRDQGIYAEYLEDPEAYRKRCVERDNLAHFKHVSEVLPDIFANKLTDDAWLYEDATEWDKDDLDSEGNLLSTYNPKSKWDWYAVGGRWDGCVMNWTEEIEHPEEKVTERYTREAWTEKKGGVNHLQKKDLEKFSGTFAFLDAAGQWHERGRMGWFGMVSDEQDPNEWDAQLKQLVEDVADEDWLVVVDVHI
jgi:hypothetical protein